MAQLVAAFADFGRAFFGVQFHPEVAHTQHGRTIIKNFVKDQGLALGGVRGAAEAPWYVADKDLARNVLVVTQHHDDPRLMSRAFTTEPAHWIAGAAPSVDFGCTVKTRYRQPDQACTVTVLADGRCAVRTEVPQRAVTPGQSAVFYDGETCLGGAVIAGRIPDPAAAPA